MATEIIQPTPEVTDSGRFQELEINMGPQHPSTHGVLRLFLSLDQETITSAQPHLGYLHRSVEKMAEIMNCHQFLPYCDRADYVAAIGPEFAYCLAVEKLAGIEVPRKAQYMRLISMELNRIASHLLFCGTYGTDLAAVTVFLYGFRDRERALDLIDELCGQRLEFHYLRVGGVIDDTPNGFDKRVKDFCNYMKPRLEELDQLLTDNKIFRSRTENVGTISTETALNYGLSGPNLRATGLAWDVRKVEPYSCYDEFEFEIPVGKRGDCFDRYWVRTREMRESIKILEQAVGNIPEGEWQAKVARNLKLPAGQVYARVEGARGDLGVYLAGDGSLNALRMKMRAPSFIHVSALPYLLKGWKIADAIAILGSIDIVIGETDR